jgi:hypothetical protein
VTQPTGRSFSLTTIQVTDRQLSIMNQDMNLSMADIGIPLVRLSPKLCETRSRLSRFSYRTITFFKLLISMMTASSSVIRQLGHLRTSDHLRVSTCLTRLLCGTSIYLTQGPLTSHRYRSGQQVVRCPHRTQPPTSSCAFASARSPQRSMAPRSEIG